MYRLILLTAAIAMLTGCSIQPLPIVAMPASAESPAFATLANANDPGDMAAASIINQAAVQLYSIKSALKNRRIGSNQAIAATTCVDSVRDHVLRGVAIRDVEYINQAKPMLAMCKEKQEKSL